MKTSRLLFFAGLLAFLVPAQLFAQNAWINEFHYDNSGTDADEFIEIVVENPGSYTLSNFSVVLYNGNNGASYDTKTLDLFTAGATVGNFKFYYYNYTANGGSIQNGAPDGMALAYSGTLIAGQFLSYEGTLTATDGPASGLTSVDIGVFESSTTPAGFSLQLGGTGSTYSAFAWQTEAQNTMGVINNNQDLGGAPDPEPTNYPTAFTAVPSPFSVNLSWVDAIGAQLPGAYLVLASDQSNITAPVDGTPVPDDATLSDGNGALNISQGSQACMFTNLPSNKQFFFKIFPYTNAGTNINYKNDGTAPSASATTPLSAIIDSIHFTDYTFQDWILKNVSGAEAWVIDSIHGVSGSPCAKVSGYSGASNVNEDWLISPAMNFNNYNNEVLTFQSAYKYAGPALEVMISNDYDGVSNPGDFAWTPLTANWSAGNWVWTASGNVNVSGTSGANVYIGFKYTSTAAESSTWELDDIVIMGDVIIGMDEDPAREAQFSVSPNPASGFCRLVFNGDAEREIRLLSVTGNTVAETTSTGSSARLELGSVAPGLYLVKVTAAGSKSSQVGKLVVR